MSYFQLLFRGNSLYLKGDSGISQNNKDRENLHFMGYGTQGFVNSFCFYYLNENKEIILHLIKIDVIGEARFIDRIDSETLIYKSYGLYYINNKKKYYYCFDSFKIQETDKDFRALQLADNYDFTYNIIRRKNDNKFIENDFTNYSCGWEYLALIKNSNLIVYNNFDSSEPLNLGPAEKIFCGFECLFFLFKKKLYIFGKHSYFNKNFKKGDKPIFLFKAEDFYYKSDVLSILKNKKWFYYGYNKNNKISNSHEKESLSEFSPIKECWAPEKHKFYSDKFKKNIFTLLLINLRVSQLNTQLKIPKFVLFEIIKFL